jgi:DNA recombination-dependent growth factor C
MSLARYRVEGKVPDPFLDTVRAGLKDYMIREIDNDPAEKSVGWTCFETPYAPDFDKVNLVFGTRLLFCLRIDKKQIPSRVMKKHVNMAVSKRLSESDRQSLTRSEEREVQDEVARRLYMRIPATPNVYEVVWDYEAESLWFFTTQKAANEELESIFAKTFKLSIIRLFPFTRADLVCGLSESQKDGLYRLAPSLFSRGGAHA